MRLPRVSASRVTFCDDLAEPFLRLELEKIVLSQLQPFRAELELFDALLDTGVELFRLDVLDAFERVDHPAHGLGAVALLIRGKKERVDEVLECSLEVAQLELDAAGDLGQSAIERIELAGSPDLFVGEVPLTLRVVEPAEDLVGAVVVRRLQLGDLEQLDGFRGLVLGHVVLGQADILRSVDLVASALGVDVLSQHRVARRFRLRFEVASAREVDPDSDGAGFQLLRHLEQMNGLVVHSLVGVAAGQRHELVGIDGNARLRGNRSEARAMRRGDRLLRHGERIL